jgi:putative tryptophan/tyrosine transport system substrate-binding protein
VVTVTPNFALLEMSHPEVASLVAAMLQARDAVERRSWAHPQEPTGEEWWADVLADPRARKRERHTGLELLKEVAPRVARVAVIRDAAAAAGVGQWGAIQAVAPSFRLELSPIDPRDAGEIERAVTAFARERNGGLIVTLSTLAAAHRDLIIALAARHKLPAVYYGRHFVTSGGLISYGPNTIDPARSAASYVNRILKGEKPADLPVQAPTKYELVINLKTAKALGLEVPATLLARADEVIE